MMTRKSFINSALAMVFVLCPFFYSLYAQTEKQKLVTTILQKDSLFWGAYNTCDTEKFRQFFIDSLEFYHDKGGLTVGLENLASSFKKNLCSDNGFRLRRQVVEGTVKVFPLQNANSTYGAIISGEHVFYIMEKGKKERLDGLARFTHVWILKDTIWKMSRVLSYDHGPAIH